MQFKAIQPLLYKVQESVSSRLTQIDILKSHRGFPQMIKDQEFRSQTRRNLRLIKQNELLRISEEDKTLDEIPSLKYFSKQNVLVLEQILVKLMSRYLGAEFAGMKRGVFEDLMRIFQQYYQQINMTSKVREMTVIRNLNISEEVDFARRNLTLFVQHTRQSMNSLLNRERMKFYNATKETPREMIKQSGQRRHGVSVQNQAESPRRAKKRQYVSYIAQISKLLVLETESMANAAYFQKSENVDSQRKMSILEVKFTKKNQEVRQSIGQYTREYLARSTRS